MRAVSGSARVVVVATALLALLPQYASACYQIDNPFVVLTGDVVAGKVTHDAKPISNARLVLRAWKQTKEWNKAGEILARTKSDSEGNFSFGPKPSGLYWIEMTAPSHEGVGIGLAHDKKSPSTKLHMAYTADFCHNYKAF